MDSLIKLNCQTAGRDKLFRLIQYSSRLVWASLQRKEVDKDFIILLKNLENILSTGRKLFRFGRGVDTLYGALSSLHLRDPTLRYLITLSKVNMALYLLTDHIIWMGRANLITVDKGKWSTSSYKYWLFALVMNLCRDFYELKQIWGKVNFSTLNYELHGQNKSHNTMVSHLELFYKVLKLHKDVIADTVKNGCDVCLPLAQLGYLKLSPQTVGLLGAMSSVLGILPLVNSSYKLAP